MEQVHTDIQFSSDHQKNYDHHPLSQYQYKRWAPEWLHSLQEKKGICPKLIRSFDGPYLVIKRLSVFSLLDTKGSKIQIQGCSSW